MAMAAASSSLVLFHKPTCNFYFQHSSAPAYISSPRRCSLIFPMNSRRSLCSFSAPKTMAYLVKTHALRDGEEERFQTLQQDAFITNPSNDLVGGGINAAANRLSKWVVAALFGSVLLLRRDGASLWAVIGFISNSLLSVTLKRILNQERPVATSRSDPGMPSSHAQSNSFISLFTLFSVMEWLGANPLSLFLSGLILALASYFTWLRVSQKLHTTSQVMVGAIVGSVFSTLWYITWNSLVLQAFASSQIAVFTVAAASALGSAVYVLLNWSKEDR
ncbi:hypothetical protein BRARA_I00906 [Brassica rapa]|uniref:Phosphatidic acid phosphatase type 2/haloperoxidase domain-containing protein n=3 Tax=Brassica TaxID=3705 RepID=A0ABQ8BW67_BRANA|nr:lipid phosphate phosphatase epsilon 2, chloroplastic [Brassica rapa]XP_013661310.2 lipid phosphate phosphatase epsilon 2, chloroplastic-like [Brassica napus]KAH0909054.1 hypothetical protein HID58_032375 [Brassica napus]RID44086.1 hypothetical protein BRARA_I00906 [Brassica rapa]